MRSIRQRLRGLRLREYEARGERLPRPRVSQICHVNVHVISCGTLHYLQTKWYAKVRSSLASPIEPYACADTRHAPEHASTSVTVRSPILGGEYTRWLSLKLYHWGPDYSWILLLQMMLIVREWNTWRTSSLEDSTDRRRIHDIFASSSNFPPPWSGYLKILSIEKSDADQLEATWRWIK